MLLAGEARLAHCQPYEPRVLHGGYAVVKSKKSESELKLDRRGSSERRNAERRTQSGPVAVERRSMPRREKVSRRRQIDPTTCERDYTPEEIEFMHALERYKRANGRMFPTCSEVLEVLLSLGYQKPAGHPAPQIEA